MMRASPSEMATVQPMRTSVSLAPIILKSMAMDVVHITVEVSENAWAQNPAFAGSSLMWIEPNKPVTVLELHRGVVISSGNDATVAIADHDLRLGGTGHTLLNTAYRDAQLTGRADHRGLQGVEDFQFDRQSPVGGIGDAAR